MLGLLKCEGPIAVEHENMSLVAKHIKNYCQEAGLRVVIEKTGKGIMVTEVKGDQPITTKESFSVAMISLVREAVGDREYIRVQEIAEIMGVDPDTSSAHIGRALSAMGWIRRRKRIGEPNSIPVWYAPSKNSASI